MRAGRRDYSLAARIAFVRTLLHKPEWTFMGEATAALDDDNQTAMMSIFKDELRRTTLISVGHRPGLEKFHDRTLHLVKTKAGALRTRMHNALPDLSRSGARKRKRRDGLLPRLFAILGIISRA
jgi:vitamin B12/bleomycin/antimicrobial peptide transport system ATP-binding/permease protein